MLYLVTEFAKNGEIFGKQESIFMFNILILTSEVCQLYLSCPRIPLTVVCHFALFVKNKVNVSHFGTNNFRKSCYNVQ